jgi:DNA-binding NtrC family response regulator
VRIIAATNKDLTKEVAANRFRDDLYFRLNVITIPIPSLRDRIEDIALLVNYFLSQGARGPRAIDADAQAALTTYRWPGNVRELANVIERAKILADGASITLRDLPSGIVQPSAAARPGEPSAPPSNGMHLEDLERKHIQRILETEAWNKARAARALGISRRRLYRLLEKYNISK